MKNVCFITLCNVDYVSKINVKQKLEGMIHQATRVKHYIKQRKIPQAGFYVHVYRGISSNIGTWEWIQADRNRAYFVLCGMTPALLPFMIETVVTNLMHYSPKDRKEVTALYLVMNVKDTFQLLRVENGHWWLSVSQAFSTLFIVFPCPCSNKHIPPQAYLIDIIYLILYDLL